MNTNTTKLTLKLPPEVEKVMPWIVSAKASGVSKLAEWARREYEIASEHARQRERRERESEARRQAYEREQKEQKEREQHLFEEWQKQRARWALLGMHFALEDDFEEIQPSQSSVKGFRRLFSEHPDILRHSSSYYRYWGDKGRSNWNKRNCGRKPRKPWYK